MTHQIFDKTEKGREEIATRKYKLSPRLRTLLVMIDGKQSDSELLGKVGGLGLTDESFAELLAGEFIQLSVNALPEPVAPATAPVSEQQPATTLLADGVKQFQAIYQFYTETIKGNIGLRGYALQLKVEKAASIDDFRELRQPYLEAVLKAKGNEVAHSLGERLDQLLHLGEAAPNTAIINAAVE
ncbi:hypothetical protein EGT07_12545 [Herbaspirillum sp. HC18]|nr:hypothetical protein EGT07_12545 [Herbaspirillum sp. HC18]